MHSTMGSNDRQAAVAWVVGAMLLPGAALPLQVLAQDAAPWPVRPVSIIAPFPPGGSTDILARMDAAKLAQAFGQPFIVEHKAGAGGGIAFQYTARATPDGHTITLVSAGFTFLAMLQRQPMYDPVRDFAPLSLMSLSPNLVVVHPASPIRSFGDLIAYARSHPGEVNYGTSGPGSFAHMAGEWLGSMSGTKYTFVPYKGLGDALLGVASGQIHVTATAVTSSMPFVKSGRLRAIAVTTAERLKVMPDLPSASEALRGYAWAQWNGYLAPARTPRPVVERLGAELRKIAASPENVKILAADGAIPVGNTSDEFAKVIATEAAQWAKLIKSINLKLDD